MRDPISGTPVEEKYQKTTQKLESLTSSAHTSKLNLGIADSLTLGFAILQLTLLGFLARWVRKHPVSTQDISITRALQRKDSRLLRYTALAFTFISSPKIMMPVMVPVVLIFWKMRLRLTSSMLAVLTLVNEVTKLLIKRFVGRPRPNPALVRVYKNAHGQSFPSGNAASAVTFWGWLMTMGMMHLKGRARKMLLFIPAVIIIFIGPSRVYLGDHWATDVLGGYLLGGSWLALVLRIYLKLWERGVSVRPGMR
jgi:undecaprenyl-diphosphatase